MNMSRGNHFNHKEKAHPGEFPHIYNRNKKI